MLRINLFAFCTFVCAIILSLTTLPALGQQESVFRKPWPTYSLQNMPQTRFTCHDKILGGYYADPETQCQMFHVCVKVAGVGVQDFRFLCPNSTAFDQEAQICADWGDVDCEQSVLYYGSDNFDLYRLGSGFESKRAPLAEEDESTFHLQRAESGDIRRYKETRVDQKSRPDQPPNYTKHYETVTRGANSYNGGSSAGRGSNYDHNNQHNLNNYDVPKKQKSKVIETTSKKPIISYYTPTSSTTTTPRAATSSTTTTTTTTTERYYDDSKQDFDDIFKGSHSSHFFSNRNGGREDDFPEQKQKPNDFTDFSKKSEFSSTTGKSRATTQTRSKRPQQTVSYTSTTPTTTTTESSRLIKKISSQAPYVPDYFNYQSFKSSTAASFSTTTSTTPKPYSNANRFNLPAHEYQIQANIQPTTYNPNRFKVITPKYTELKRNEKSDTGAYNKPSTNNNKLIKYEQTQQKLGPQNSTFVNKNEFQDFIRIKPQQPQPFQVQPAAPNKLFEAPIKTSNIEPQFFRSRGPPAPRVAVNQQPEPFKAPPAPATQRQNGQRSSLSAKTVNVNSEKSLLPSPAEVSKPRGFVSRGSINYKATTQRESETYATTTSAQNHKKFSTLVPKDKYSSPTTFKPATYKKPYDNQLYQAQQTGRPLSTRAFTSAPPVQVKTTEYTTANPYYNVDEDDGQYHPELYEVDFPRNKFNLNRQSPAATSTSTTTSTTTTTSKPFYYTQQHQQQRNSNNFQNPVNHLKTQQQTSLLKEQQSSSDANDFSDEDELFKTAQSLNFGAASINKLRADIFKAEKTSQQYNSQYNPHNSITTSPKITYPTTAGTTPRPSTTTSTTTFRPSSSNDFLNFVQYTTQQQTTSRPSTINQPISISTTVRSTTTTRRPTTIFVQQQQPSTRPSTTTTTSTPFYSNTTPFSINITKSGKHEKKLKKQENKKKSSKRPAHADEDTSYDYAYYDTDTLSETPQEYPEYEIQEFSKTKKN